MLHVQCNICVDLTKSISQAGFVALFLQNTYYEAQIEVHVYIVSCSLFVTYGLQPSFNLMHSVVLMVLIIRMPHEIHEITR